MRKIALSSLAACFCFAAAAQYTEFSAGLNSGLLSFRGNSVESSSFVISSNSSTAYTNDIYSNKPGFGIGVDISLLRVGKKGFVYGIASGLELMKHNMPVTAIVVGPDSYPATGTIHMHTRFITIKPVAGHRFYTRKKGAFDIAASLETAIGLSFLDEVGVAKIKGSDTRVHVSHGRDDIITDYRAGLLATFVIKRYSIMAGYYRGLRNFYQDYTGSMEAYSKLFRIRFGFQLNKLHQVRKSGSPEF